MRVQARAGHAPEAPEHASLSSRGFAYLLDSLVLFAFTMVFVSGSFINIFFRSDNGRENPSDAAITDSVIILFATIPLWFLLNLVMGLKRGQSIGQYVVGLRLTRETGGSPGFFRLVLYWLALHPLLYHPLLAGFWFIFAFVSISLSESEVVFIGALALGFLSLVAPLASFVFALGDAQRRGLHDWIAGTKVVRIE
jgi:uncharacterized RDD family membrane protein YckC